MEKLIFVYNANSGKANALLDFGKKYVAPSTYDCQLCMISYGPFGMKKDWKQFTESLPYDVSFLHKDEFEKQHPEAHIDPPGLLYLSDTGYQTLLDAQDFDNIASLEELKKRVDQALLHHKD